MVGTTYTNMAMRTGKVIEIFQVMGITVGEGMGEKWRWSKGVEEEWRREGRHRRIKRREARV